MTTFTLAGILLNSIGFRYPSFRPWLAGRAAIVIRDGEPLLETDGAFSFFTRRDEDDRDGAPDSGGLT